MDFENVARSIFGLKAEIKPVSACLVTSPVEWTQLEYSARIFPSLTRRAPKGERLIDKVPQGHWKTATFLAALRNDRIDAPCLFDGPINGERFRAYVEQFLVPTLKPSDVVILDNLGSHKGKAVRKAIRNVGARLVHCPAMFPDVKSSVN